MSTENESSASRTRSRRRVLDTDEQDNDSSATFNTPRKKMKVVGDVEMKQVAAYVKKHRSSVITMDAKLDILLLQAKLRHEHYVKQKLLSPGRKSSKAEATNRVASYLLRKKETVGEVWSDYVNGKVMQVANPAGNYRRKSTRVPRVAGVISMVQRFVRDRRLTRTRTVAKDVMDFLDGCGFITVDRESKTSVESALRSVRRFLERTGYKRGKKKGMMCYRLKEENVRKRDSYVQLMTEANNDVSRRIVYMDESYIHKNYQRRDDSLFDPNDEQDLETKAQHKGKRYCFIAAIIDDSRSPDVMAIPDDVRPDVDKAGLMHETLDIFEGGKKQTADYHGMFDSVYFIKWMDKLLQALAHRNVENALIVMDNAKYHKCLPDGTPKGSWKKQRMVEYCNEHNIPVSPSDLKNVIWDRLKKHIDQNIKPVVVSMAEASGHKVVWSPPHHSDLQPIELIWANVKGTVGRQYTTNTTFKDVLIRLKKAFDELQTTTVRGCIRKAKKHLDELLQHILQQEQADEDGEIKEDEENDAGSDSEDD